MSGQSHVELLPAIDSFEIAIGIEIGIGLSFRRFFDPDPDSGFDSTFFGS